MVSKRSTTNSTKDARKAQANCQNSFCGPLSPWPLPRRSFSRSSVKPIAPKANGHQDRKPHVRIGGIGEQEVAMSAVLRDEQTAHRGRAGLLLMALRNFGADGLADLRRAKTLDQPRTQRQRKRQRGESRQHGAERLVAQDVEAPDCDVQRVQEKIEHRVAGRLRRPSRRSVPAPPRGRRNRAAARRPADSLHVPCPRSARCRRAPPVRSASAIAARRSGSIR